ncbi:MAG TPA: hypothetical protein DEF34_08515 [Desulfotomaculum sp.]|nr:MAG: hypothetical protein JL56_07145 [Desulfotomaculum sp. BICA1-6]HBX23655.1 hypothetical protein [Desulfotomaculum sp.]
MGVRRDVVFVFGAGASYADGAPLQDEILPIILSGKLKDIEASETGTSVCQFIKDNFAWDNQAGVYPTLESVFGFLDYFINQDEHLSAGYPNGKIHALKEGLIKLIHYVISERSNRQAMIYKSFWETVCLHNTSLSILTLNYDTLLEEALKSVHAEAHIDYCIHLMNYDLREDTAWVNPGELRALVDGNKPVVVRIMKGHGSLNWKYCNCCNQVLLTPWDTKIDLYSGAFIKDCEHTAGASKYSCPVDGSEFETLIIPPSHIKRISHPVVSQILNASLRAIRACRKVIFVGYSFPDADVHFKALFKKALINNQEVYVVNRTIDQKLKLNYTSLSRGVNFIESPFADFIKDDPLVQQVLR